MDNQERTMQSQFDATVSKKPLRKLILLPVMGLVLGGILLAALFQLDGVFEVNEVWVAAMPFQLEEGSDDLCGHFRFSRLMEFYSLTDNPENYQLFLVFIDAHNGSRMGATEFSPRVENIPLLSTEWNGPGEIVAARGRRPCVHNPQAFWCSCTSRIRWEPHQSRTAFVGYYLLRRDDLTDEQLLDVIRAQYLTLYMMGSRSGTINLSLHDVGVDWLADWVE